MQELPIQALPRQSFTFVFEQNRWEVRIVQAGNAMFADFTLNDEVLITGVRCRPGVAMLPYEYLQFKAGGNFSFVTGNGNNNLPWWQDFGVTCYLYFATLEEVQDGI